MPKSVKPAAVAAPIAEPLEAAPWSPPAPPEPAAMDPPPVVLITTPAELEELRLDVEDEHAAQMDPDGLE